MIQSKIMKKILTLLIILLTSNLCFALPEGVNIKEYLNRPYLVKSFDDALNGNKPFLLVLASSKDMGNIIKFIPVGEMVDKEFGKDFDFCIINTEMEENSMLIEFFKPKSIPALYIVDTNKDKFLYVNEKYYSKNSLRHILKKYLNGKLF